MHYVRCLLSHTEHRSHQPPHRNCIHEVLSSLKDQLARAETCLTCAAAAAAAALA